MIYKSGDKVRIVKKIPAKVVHGFAEDMAYFLGKIVTIFDRRINTFVYYKRRPWNLYVGSKYVSKS